MSLSSAPRTPSRLLLPVVLFNLAALACALLLATGRPWLGLDLESAGADGDAPGVVKVVASSGPAAAIPAGVELLAIGAGSPKQRIALQGTDLLEEPDVLPDYAAMNAFLARQDSIAALLAAGPVELEWKTADGRSGTTSVLPQPRPLDSLTLEFWFQVLVAISGCLLAAWVWALNPGNWGTRLFGITGLSFPVFAISAAVYSSRELALPAELFRTLGMINHWGSYMFGAALVGIFLAYPRPLVRPRHLVWPFVIFNLWGVTDLLQWASNPDIGNRFLVMTEMLLAVVLGIVQWRRTRGAALERAALRWLLLSILVGSGLFIMSIVLTASLGWLPPLPQGYAFGFFLFIYVGIALGLRRYRLFELDQWAWRMLVWVGGALAVIGIDALLILTLDWSAPAALGASLWICAALYFPLRQWLWIRLTRQQTTQPHELMANIVAIAFQPSSTAQASAWDALLQGLHDPLELVSDGAAPPVSAATISEDGIALRVPACGGVEARRLRFPGRGRRLLHRARPPCSVSCAA